MGTGFGKAPRISGSPEKDWGAQSSSRGWGVTPQWARGFLWGRENVGNHNTECALRVVHFLSSDFPPKKMIILSQKGIKKRLNAHIPTRERGLECSAQGTRRACLWRAAHAGFGRCLCRCNDPT